MRIHLDEDEIVDALKEYIEATGIPLNGKTVVVHLVAGRGVNGHKAQVEISKLPAEIAEEESQDGVETDEEQPAILFDSEEE